MHRGSQPTNGDVKLSPNHSISTSVVLSLNPDMNYIANERFKCQSINWEVFEKITKTFFPAY